MSVLEVGNKKEFKTIKNAIEAASDGDEIVIEPGCYSECFEINKELYIHSTQDLTKAKNNFASDDIPIIYIKSFETLKITEKCRIENLLFTQKKDLNFGLLSEILVRAENDCEITGDKIIHDLENDDFGTMLEIDNDLSAKNCFFVFSAYHGLSILKNTSSFERCIFSNSYADDIFICNDATLKLDNKCFVKNTSNGYGIFANGQSNIDIKNTNFINTECSSIMLSNNSNALINDCDFTTSELAITTEGSSNIKVSNCNVQNNLTHGIQITESSNAQITNCIFSNNKKNGVMIAGNGMCHIFDSTFTGNDVGIGLVKESICEVSDTKIKNNQTAGVVLNNSGNITISKSTIHGSSVSFYSQNDGKCKINESELSGASNSGIYLLNNSFVELYLCKIHDCNNGLYLSDCSSANVLNSIINMNSDAFYLSENSKIKVSKSTISDNKSNAFWQSDNSITLVENSIIFNNDNGININDSAKCNSYKTQISNNEYGIHSSQNASGNYIHCKIEDNKNGYFKLYGSTKFETFINCIFSNEIDYHENEKKCIKNLTQAEEEQYYNNIFNSSDISITDYNDSSLNQNTVQSLFDEKSIDVIISCLSQIKEKFDLTIFYKKNIKKLVSVCKDLYPNNEDEMAFIKSLEEKGLLEQLAKKKLDDDFFEKLLKQGYQFTNKKTIGLFVIYAESIFQLPLQKLLAKEAGDN